MSLFRSGGSSNLEPKEYGQRTEGQFVVSLDLSRTKLASTFHSRQQGGIYIDGIPQGDPIQTWNAEHPSAQLRVDDYVLYYRNKKGDWKVAQNEAQLKKELKGQKHAAVYIVSYGYKQKPRNLTQLKAIMSGAEEWIATKPRALSAEEEEKLFLS